MEAQQDKLYISTYLKIVPTHRGTQLLFNGYTGAVDEVSNDFAEQIEKCRRTNGPLAMDMLNCFGESEIRFLIQRGHISRIERSDEISEANLFIEELNKYRRTLIPSSGTLIIIPTYNCNLACPYCFEQDVRYGENRKRIMTLDQIDRIFTRLLDRLFPGVTDKSKIKLEFYGGEPFLKSNRILVERILSYAKKFKMRATAISNGTQVDEMLYIFGSDPGHISWIQVTLDGNEDNHNKTRVGLDGKPTFDKILANIKLLQGRKIKIDIRINCQKKTLPTLPALVNRLKEEGILGDPNVCCYAWPVHSNYVDKTCADLSHKELSDYLRNNHLLIEDSVDVWQGILKDLINASEGIPHQRTVFCMKNKPNVFLYDPFDNLYSCLDEGGRLNKRSGHIDDEDNVILTDEYKIAQDRLVSRIEGCEGCPLTLLCAGDCPSEAERYNGTIFSSGCTTRQQCFDDALREAYRKHCEGRSDCKAI